MKIEPRTKTEILMVLDRSGSMGPIAEDTVGGVNSFIKQQQSAEGEASLTIAIFDSKYEIVRNDCPINDVPPLVNGVDFVPRGSTALYDAVGQTIECGRRAYAKLTPEQRPDSIILVIVTDGHENSSRHYSAEQVRRMIRECEQEDWSVIYLSADERAMLHAREIGVSEKRSMQYRKAGRNVGHVFSAADEMIREKRANSSAVLSIKRSHREKAMEESDD